MSRVLDPRLVGVLRAATGLGFLLRSSSIAEAWVESKDVPARTLTRSVGIRDAVIGLGLAAQGTTPWLAASVAADLMDGAEALLGDVPASRRRSVAAWAFGFAAYGLLSLVSGRRRVQS